MAAGTRLWSLCLFIFYPVNKFNTNKQGAVTFFSSGLHNSCWQDSCLTWHQLGLTWCWVSWHCHTVATLSWQCCDTLDSGTLLTLALLTRHHWPLWPHSSSWHQLWPQWPGLSHELSLSGLAWADSQCQGVTHQEPLSSWHSPRHDTSSAIITNTTISNNLYDQS